MSLALGDLLTVLDSVAKGVDLFEGALGLLGTEPDTVSLGAAHNVATLEAIADIDVQADLATVFRSRAETVKAGALYRTLGGSILQRALDKHYGDANAGSLNAFLKTQDARVHPNLVKVGFQVDGENTFCPTAVDPVGGFAVTGRGAGAFTAGTDIDTTRYGKANMAIVAATVIGAEDITATLTMKKYDGSTEAQDVTIPAGSAIGTTLPIGTPGTDMYVGVAGISIVGGTAADGFKVVSQVERVLAL